MFYTAIGLYSGVALGQRCLQKIFKGISDLSGVVFGQNSLESRIEKFRDEILSFRFFALKEEIFGNESLKQRAIFFRRGVETLGHSAICGLLAYIILFKVFNVIPPGSEEIEQGQSECNHQQQAFEAAFNETIPLYNQRKENLCILKKLEIEATPFLENCYRIYQEASSSYDLINENEIKSDPTHIYLQFCTQFISIFLHRTLKFDFLPEIDIRKNIRNLISLQKTAESVCKESLKKTSRFVGANLGPFMEIDPTAYCRAEQISSYISSKNFESDGLKKCKKYFWPNFEWVQASEKQKTKIPSMGEPFDCSQVWESLEFKKKLSQIEQKKLIEEFGTPFINRLTSHLLQIEGGEISEGAVIKKLQIQQIVTQALQLNSNFFLQLNANQFNNGLENSTISNSQTHPLTEEVFALLKKEPGLLQQKIPGINQNNQMHDETIRRQIYRFLMLRFKNNIENRVIFNRLSKIDRVLIQENIEELNQEINKLKAQNSSFPLSLLWGNIYEECNSFIFSNGGQCKQYRDKKMSLDEKNQTFSGLSELNNRVLV